MAQPTSLNINYPFGDSHKQNLEDAQSYHSITIDPKKLQYFDCPTNNFQLTSNNCSSKMSQTHSKRKNPLPPSYPYEEVKKLKQSLKFQNKSKEITDNQSIQSVDSFHTVNEFQSICYEDGDFQKIIHQMQEHKNTQQIQYQKLFPQESSTNSQRQKAITNQQIHRSITSFQSISRKENKRNDEIVFEQNIPIQQSNALNEIDIQELQNGQISVQKFERFEEASILREKQPTEQIQDKHDGMQIDEEGNDTQISHIQDALNESELVDQEILQLTRQLQNIQSSQQQISKHNQLSQQCLHKQQNLAQRYLAIQSRLKQLQSTQKNFTSQIANMYLFIQKTKQNNSYLKKELQFFKEKSKHIEEKERLIQEKEKKIQQKQLNTSKHQSFRFGQHKIKPKTFHIKPKAPNNQTAQSRKYKEFTFEYCLGNKNPSNKDQWYELEIDSQNTPPEYKLIYSFQHQNTILAVRLVDLVSNDSSRSSVSSKKPSGQGSFVKKNYQYLMDFAQNKYESQEKKLQSLSKELILNLDQQRYVCKEFTKKIEIFLMICEEETFVDLVKLVPLPNPIAFFIEPRFNFLGNVSHQTSNQSSQKNRLNLEIQTENKSGLKKDRGILHYQFSRNLANLSKFMKTYIIKIQHMADVESIQKLMGLNWINSGSNQESKYFTIKGQEIDGSSRKSNQLFHVKIDDCILQNSADSQCLDPKHRYSLVFRVSSTSDNDLLVDLIEFLTFLTIY